jgi:hypothetical protein
MAYNFTTPILLIIFNRPHITNVIFNRIKKIRPLKLYIAADGPRNIKNEKELCAETRSIINQIDWSCDLKTDFLDHNVGCDERVPSAIDWLFKYEDRGIILEDDCVPNEDFFNFCEQLLDRYENNEKIMMISGNNFQEGIKRGDGSFYFSRYANTWGWATWKRSWQYFQYKFKNFDSFIKYKKIQEIFRSKEQQKYWLNFFQKIHRGKYTFWDAKWTYSIWEKDGVCIIPNVNLVTNIGYGNDSTHNISKKLSIHSAHISFPLSFPTEKKVDSEADMFQFTYVYKTSIITTILTKLKNVSRNLKKKIKTKEF